ncbi:hypothetical protein AVEN_170681-1 [Araneus ventricosus]|uniref:Guanylate cyclase domain-containing protein n=1 Tax=Araneus ventricosus TaxID=182803 RepID=A0A4Y2S1P6_ARAVE|nr:hypothetical protein AVEN_170681-1 [Araneus ventricosus]
MTQAKSSKSGSLGIRCRAVFAMISFSAAVVLLNAGGDILNFAGDAFLVYWKDSEEAVEKAYNCAVDLQTHQCLQEKNLGGTLQSKIGTVCSPFAVFLFHFWVQGIRRVS